MNVTLNTVLETLKIPFVLVVLKLKPQRTILCVAITLVQKGHANKSIITGFNNTDSSFAKVNNNNLIDFLLYDNDKWDEKNIVVN